MKAHLLTRNVYQWISNNEAIPSAAYAQRDQEKMITQMSVLLSISQLLQVEVESESDSLVKNHINITVMIQMNYDSIIMRVPNCF